MLKLEWGDESRRYAYTRFPSERTWQAFHANRLQYEEMLSSVSHRVDFVADLTDAVVIPGNMVSNIVSVFNKRLENEGYVILIGAGQMIQLAYNMIETILPIVKNYVIFVANMEEALELVARNRKGEIANH